MNNFLFTLYVIAVYTGHQLFVSILKNSVFKNIILIIKLYDDNYYIYTTCDNALQKNSVPCQAVANRLNVVELPKLFQDIRRLERLLLSRRSLL